MAMTLRYLRLLVSGAVLGVAVASLFGVDTSILGNAGIASVFGAGSTVALIKLFALA